MKFPEIVKGETDIIYNIEDMICIVGEYASFYSNRKKNIIRIKVNAEEEIDTDCKNRQIVLERYQDICNEQSIDLGNIKCNTTELLMPVDVLSVPFCGFVYEISCEFVNLKDLYLKDLKEYKHRTLEWYIITGGLYRRILILRDMISVFMKMKSVGIMHVNVCPQNIYVSLDKADSLYKVYVLGGENLCNCSLFFDFIGEKYYRAPEIAQKVEHNSYESMEYAFSLLSFELLSMGKAFFGKGVCSKDKYEVDEEYSDGIIEMDKDEDDEWVIEDEESDDMNNCVQQTMNFVDSNEEDNITKADIGKVPWVYDSVNDSNSHIIGLYKDYIFQQDIMNLFERNFSVSGRNNPDERPSFLEWFHVLNNSRNRIIVCKKCGFSYYVKNNECPACNQKSPDMYLALIYSRYPKMEQSLIEKYHGNELLHKHDISFELIESGFNEIPKEADVKVIPVSAKSLIINSYEVFDGYKDIMFDGNIRNVIKISNNLSNYEIELLDDSIEISIDEKILLNKDNHNYKCKDLNEIELVVKIDNESKRYIVFKSLTR